MNKPLAADLKPWLDANEKPFIEIKNLSKRFSNELVLDQVNLKIYQGEFFALLGGSGSGKTTLLRIIAGLETPDEGDVLINGQSMLELSASERPTNLMFQSYALFPHMSAYNNIAFGLENDGLPKAEIKARVEHYLKLVELEAYASKKPHQLSGGQCQRVALARALVKQPQFVLLDEPLGALDHKLREKTQFELVALQEKLHQTMMVVTHDQNEAMALSTRIGILRAGKIEQVDEPIEIYNNPKNQFVAHFLGSTNFIKAEVEQLKDSIRVSNFLGACELTLRDDQKQHLLDEIVINIRPEDLKLSKDEGHLDQINFDFISKAKVIDIAFMGDHRLYKIKLPNDQIIIAKNNENEINWDDEIIVSWKRTDCNFLTH